MLENYSDTVSAGRVTCWLGEMISPSSLQISSSSTPTHDSNALKNSYLIRLTHEYCPHTYKYLEGNCPIMIPIHFRKPCFRNERIHRIHLHHFGSPILFLLLGHFLGWGARHRLTQTVGHFITRWSA